MEKILRKINTSETIKYPELVSQYTKSGDIFLTIETTGLSPERHRIVSVSCGHFSGDEVECTIYFSENDEDELSVIEAASKEIKKASRVITWNGDSFDLKFLSERASVYAKKIEPSSSFVKIGHNELPSYDLTHLLRPVKRYLPDQSLSIYTLLSAIGLNDNSLPDGRTVVTLYKTWLATDEEKYRTPIIDHTIYKLTGIMNLMSLVNCTRINHVKPVIDAIGVSDDMLRVKGHSDIFFPVSMKLTLPGITLIFSKNDLDATFDYNAGSMRIYFPDPASYVRLNESGKLIPKELSKSLPKDAYSKVTRNDCYTTAALPSDPDKQKMQLASYIGQLVKM